MINELTCINSANAIESPTVSDTKVTDVTRPDTRFHFPKQERIFARAAWDNYGIGFVPQTDSSTVFPTPLSELTILKSPNGNDNQKSQLHHSVPKYVFTALNQVPTEERLALVREFVPFRSSEIAALLIDNPNHILNGVPFMPIFHNNLHEFPIEEYWIMYRSIRKWDYNPKSTVPEDERVPFFANLNEFQERCFLMGVNNWATRYLEVGFTMQTIVLFNYLNLENCKLNISKQTQQDIINFYQFLFFKHPAEFVNCGIFLQNQWGKLSWEVLGHLESLSDCV